MIADAATYLGIILTAIFTVCAIDDAVHNWDRRRIRRRHARRPPP